MKSAPASVNRRTRPQSQNIGSRPKSEVTITPVTSRPLTSVGHRPMLHRASSFLTESQMSVLYSHDDDDDDDTDADDMSLKVWTVDVIGI